ncbi:MAG: hypothetical protein ACR2M3_19550 [Thermomicrobiales bacterium]
MAEEESATARRAPGRRQSEGLTLSPEIERLRSLLRQIGSDNPEERESATAEAVGMSRVISVIVRAVEVEAAIRADLPVNDAAAYQGIIQRAIAQMGEESRARDVPAPKRRRSGSLKNGGS